MEIKSITDIITNSSSEVFITVTHEDPRKLEELKSKIEEISDFKDLCGEGGIDIYDNMLRISISQDAYGYGLEEFAKLGFEAWMKQFKNDNFEIYYED